MVPCLFGSGKHAMLQGWENDKQLEAIPSQTKNSSVNLLWLVKNPKLKEFARW